MRVKAFSLIELIVVVILLGIMFSLALSSFTNRDKKLKTFNLKELPLYVNKLGLNGESTFLVLGKKCQKRVLFSDGVLSDSKLKIPFDRDFKTYEIDNQGVLKEFFYPDFIYDRKSYHVCFRLELSGGKFLNRFILQTKNSYYLFLPFFQKVEIFRSFKDAKREYLQEDSYPKSIDDYFHE